MSFAPSQADRDLRLKTPLGDDALVIQRLVCREAISRPFELEVIARSLRPAIAADDLLGQAVCVELDGTAGGTRYFHGLVSEFVQTTAGAGLSTYQLRVAPWLAFLRHRRDARIFQGLAVPDILKEVFVGAGFVDFRFSLTREYWRRGTCTQYMEDDLAFVSRLMEDEGLSYFFECSAEKHTVVICDTNAAFLPAGDGSPLPFIEKSLTAHPEDHISRWVHSAAVSATTASLSDYDYLIPRVDQSSSASGAASFALAGQEVFEHPGGYEVPEEGLHRAKLRLEEMLCRRVRASADTTSPALAAGTTFTLAGHPRRDQSRDHLVIEAVLTAEAADYSTTSEVGKGPARSCEFVAIPSDTPFRPARLTPKPCISGIQTAEVAGPEGSDPKVPHTTALGSIKVRFRWDRSGARNGTLSGWIRVAQISAGPSWGSMFVPRIGNEVAVAFEFGDPDRPVVIGSLYNANAMPALALPQFSRRSYISDDGGNALCMAPEDGSQSIILYSPTNETLHVVGANCDDRTPAPFDPLSPGIPPVLPTL